MDLLAIRLNGYEVMNAGKGHSFFARIPNIQKGLWVRIVVKNRELIQGRATK